MADKEVSSTTLCTTYDDDLDSYLDDILDDFTPKPTAQPAPPVSTIADELPDAALDDQFDDEFTRQLAANMENMLRGSLDDDGSGVDTGPIPSQAELKATMEQLVGALKDIQSNKTGNASDRSEGSTTDATSSAERSEPRSFQDRVSATMNRLRDSSEKAQVRAGKCMYTLLAPLPYQFVRRDSPSNVSTASQKLAAEVTEAGSSIPGLDDETMEQMMKELEALMSSGDFENQFGGMMEQLMSKDLLHEPMKDLAAKYPEWMNANASQVSAEDMTKYKKQLEIIKEIVAIYDACPTAEASAEDSRKVADLMQQMQECGNPPEEILQELAPGMEMGSDGLPKLGGDSCSLM
ncbi:hypothetical protein HDV00_012625 [Rhizophlyctis rosea]|nr:hypothetical protein HDV00_012625 [Rhizophlyctis rosea]